MTKNRLLTALLALSLAAPSGVVIAMKAESTMGVPATAVRGGEINDGGATVTSMSFGDGSSVNTHNASSDEMQRVVTALSAIVVRPEGSEDTEMAVITVVAQQPERVLEHLESQFLENQNWQHVLDSFEVDSIFTLGDLQNDIRSRSSTPKITALELLTESDAKKLQDEGDTLLLHPVLLYERIRHCFHPQLTPIPSASVVQTGLRLSVLLLALTMADTAFMAKTSTLPLTPNLYQTLKTRLAQLAQPHITTAKDATFRNELANIAKLFNGKSSTDYAFPSWVLNESLSFRGSNGLIFQNPDLQELLSCFYNPRGEWLMETRGNVITRALKQFGSSKTFSEFFRRADDLDALKEAVQGQEE